MKKIIAMLLCLAFLAGIMESSADAQKRKKRTARKKAIKKVVKKKAALKVKKPIAKKALPQTPAAPQYEYQAPAPWIAPPPPQYLPPPVMVTPVPVQPAVQPMHRGLSGGLKAGLTAGALAFTADLDYSLSDIINNTEVRLSGNFMTGKDEVGSRFIYRIFNVKIGGIYNLSMLKSKDLPYDLYVGSSFIYPVLLSSARTGTKWGAEVFIGGSKNIAEIGTLYGELGYGGLKYDSSQPALKGISASLGIKAVF